MYQSYKVNHAQELKQDNQVRRFEFCGNDVDINQEN